MTVLVQLLCAALGSLGFGLYFNLKKEKLLIVAVLGFICWGVYLYMMNISNQIFLSSFVATLIVSLLSEILARTIKAPSTVFYIVGIIPLVPGGTLYYMMDALVKSNTQTVKECAFMLIWTIIGMGTGVAVIQGIIRTIKKVRAK